MIVGLWAVGRAEFYNNSGYTSVRSIIYGIMSHTESDNVLERINKILGMVGESLSIHRGGIELVAFNAEDGTCSVRFTGMCDGCPMAKQTLECFVEEALSAVPEVREVVAVNVARS